jgi:hypothetical protein
LKYVNGNIEFTDDYIESSNFNKRLCIIKINLGKENKEQSAPFFSGVKNAAKYLRIPRENSY